MVISSIPNSQPQSTRITERSCKQCGNLFKGRGSFCSRGCYYLSMTAKTMRNCEQCALEFEVSLSEINRGNGRFCSKKCASVSKEKRTEKKCLECGTLFVIRSSIEKDGRGKYCTEHCFRISKDKRIIRICNNCGITFHVSPTRLRDGNSKYCSKKCFGESNRGGNNKQWRGGGSKYYGGNWSSQRKLAYERDSGVCQVCHRKPKQGERSFAVHHIVKRRNFKGDYLAANDLSNLITLCHQCHPKAEHGLMSVPKRLL